MDAIIYVFTFAVCAIYILLNIRNVRISFHFIIIASIMGGVHGLIPAIHAMTGYYDEFSTGVRITSAIFTFAATAIFIAGGWIFSTKKRVAALEVKLSRSLNFIVAPDGLKVINFMLIFSFLIGIIAFFIGLKLHGVSFTEYISVGRFQFRNEGGMLNVIVRYFVMLLPCSFFYLAFIIKRQRIWAFIIAIAAAFLIAYLNKGARIGALSSIICLLFGTLIQARRVNLKMLGGLACAGILIFFASVYIYEARKIVTGAPVFETAKLALSSKIYIKSLESDPLNYNIFLLKIISEIPHSIGYQPFATFRRTLFFPFPQQMFPYLKPIDPNLLVGEALSFRGVSIPPGLLGHAYLEYFGFFGVFMMFIYGLLFFFLSNFTLGTPIRILTMLPPSGMALLIMSRGAYYDAITVFIVVSVMFFVIIKILGIFGLKLGGGK